MLNEDDWPTQPVLESSKKANDEAKPIKEIVAYSKEAEVVSDEWDSLLERKSYWTTLTVTAWALRFINNCKAKVNKTNSISGPLTTEEIQQSRQYWILRAQSNIPETLERPGWKLERESKTGILRCAGRIQEYQPIYLEKRTFTQKLIQHEYGKVKHLGLVSTMAEIRESWHILHLRTLAKRHIRNGNICKVCSNKPYGANLTAPLPKFRTEVSRPFELIGVDFAGTILYKIGKKKEEKAYIVIFTCDTTRAVHLELTKSQTAEEFIRKLSAYIARKTRPAVIVSDNGGADPIYSRMDQEVAEE